jgi:uncharacterized small protein (TIGR04563 family)
MPTFVGMDETKRGAKKQSLYFPEQMLSEITEEAKRLDRSLSWVIQRAWLLSKGEIRRLPNSDGKI